MAQDQPKQKPLQFATVGAFESLANAFAVIFFNSSRTIKVINPPDPKP